MGRMKFYLNWITSGFIFVLSIASPSNHCEVTLVQLENGSISRNVSLLWERSIDGNLHFDFSDSYGLLDNGQGLLCIAMRLIGHGDGKSHIQISFFESEHLKYVERKIHRSSELHKELFLDLKHGVRLIKWLLIFQ